MSEQAGKAAETKKTSADTEHSRREEGREAAVPFSDNRPAAAARNQLQQAAANSPQAAQLKAVQAMADKQPAPFKKNNTGLPDQLKTGIENLSGYSMDDVSVHYNSAKPAQLQAHAYAQGSAIHIAPGQEQHLPHEAWHVVQQKQGRVRPTMQLKGKVNVNDDAGLEQEADVMGAEATRAGIEKPAQLKTRRFPAAAIAQRVLVPFKEQAAPSPNDTLVMNDAATIEGLTNAAYLNTWNRLTNMHITPLDQAHFPGVTAGHFTNFVSVMGFGLNSLKAAAIGYVIEDQVSFHAGLPAAAQSQVVLGNARPDFVITHGASRGIVDITSSGEQGHVLNKKFTKSNYRYIAESTYLSINFGALNGAAPLLTAAAHTLAADAKRRQANSFINGRMGALKRLIEMQREGVMARNKLFYRLSLLAKRRINRLRPGQAWGVDLVDNADEVITKLNTLLSADGHEELDTVESLIDNARAKYLVAGNPTW